MEERLTATAEAGTPSTSQALARGVQWCLYSDPYGLMFLLFVDPPCGEPVAARSEVTSLGPCSMDWVFAVGITLFRALFPFRFGGLAVH